MLFYNFLTELKDFVNKKKLYNKMTSALVKDESMLTTYFYGSHSIYTVWGDNQPLFNSQDVCRALGYENTENGKKAVSAPCSQYV